MCLIQQHGGPDDEGFYASENNNLVLGNRRLALLDLTPNGHMPMRYLDRFYITYNGELYNHAELKKELISLGHVFTNNTDTQVILAAFAQWGHLSFSRLEGMFAFALWDELDRQLFLVRDPSGIKPLYYSHATDHIAFSSEVRAFSAMKKTQQDRKNWPVYLMAYGHLPEPVTTLENVSPLPKGFFLKYSTADRSLSLQSFSFYSYSNQINNKAEALLFIKNRLGAAVGSHLVSDAPLGVFLSGGLDSGIIATLAAKQQNNPLNTISVYFDEPTYSEKRYQDKIVGSLSSNHHELLLREKDFNLAFPDILDSMDLPSCDGINTWFISQYARKQGFKAVLSGLGGDELFGGYPSFNRMAIAKWIACLPDFSRNAFKGASNKKLNRMTYLNMEGIKGLYLFLRGHFSPYEIAKQLDANESEIWNILNGSPVFFEVEENLGNKNLASWMEFNLYMQNQLLRDADVMSMIHGVEIRVPFLDNSHIRACLKIDEKLKFPSGLPKQFLIDVFNNDIPEMIWNRPKMGFSFPFANWLAKSPVVQRFRESPNLRLKDIFNRFDKGYLHWSQLMTLIIMSHRKII